MIRCPICNSLKTEDEPCPGCLVKYGLEDPDGGGPIARSASVRDRVSALWTPAVLFAPVTVGLSVCTFVLGLAVSQTFAHDTGGAVRDSSGDETSASEVVEEAPRTPHAVSAPPVPPVPPVVVPVPVRMHPGWVEVEAATRKQAEEAARLAAREAALAAREAHQSRQEASRVREDAERQAVEARHAAEAAQAAARAAAARKAAQPRSLHEMNELERDAERAARRAAQEAAYHE